MSKTPKTEHPAPACSLAKKHANIAIIGRIPFDDEDSFYSYKGLSRAEAIEAFKEEIYETASRPIPKGENAEVVFVNHVLVSDSPIRTL
jgi:hypothetical protein